MKKCPECGREVADYRNICDYCGYPFDEEMTYSQFANHVAFPYEMPRKTANTLVICGNLILVLSIIAGLVLSASSYVPGVGFVYLVLLTLSGFFTRLLFNWAGSVLNILYYLANKKGVR